MCCLSADHVLRVTGVQDAMTAEEAQTVVTDAVMTDATTEGMTADLVAMTADRATKLRQTILTATAATTIRKCSKTDYGIK